MVAQSVDTTSFVIIWSSKCFSQMFALLSKTEYEAIIFLYGKYYIFYHILCSICHIFCFFATYFFQIIDFVRCSDHLFTLIYFILTIFRKLLHMLLFGTYPKICTTYTYVATLFIIHRKYVHCYVVIYFKYFIVDKFLPY